MARNREALIQTLERIPSLREEFWGNVKVPGGDEEFNPQLENAGRVADFLEFAELMVNDAINREESCGCHFREEYQTEEGEALRNDEEFCFVSAWEHSGESSPPILHRENLGFEAVQLTERSYK